MTAHALPTHARRIWKKLVSVRFISPAEEDATLAALERRGQRMLSEKTQQGGSGAARRGWQKPDPAPSERG
jgi:hypothetical protein